MGSRLQVSDRLRIRGREGRSSNLTADNDFRKEGKEDESTGSIDGEVDGDGDGMSMTKVEYLLYRQ